MSYPSEEAVKEVLQQPTHLSFQSFLSLSFCHFPLPQREIQGVREDISTS